jgi:hypothetical protein
MEGFCRSVRTPVPVWVRNVPFGLAEIPISRVIYDKIQTLVRCRIWHKEAESVLGVLGPPDGDTSSGGAVGRCLSLDTRQFVAVILLVWFGIWRSCFWVSQAVFLVGLSYSALRACGAFSCRVSTLHSWRHGLAQAVRSLGNVRSG